MEPRGSSEQIRPNVIELIVLNGAKVLIASYCKQLIMGGFDEVLTVLRPRQKDRSFIICDLFPKIGNKMYDKVKMWVMGYGQDIGAYLDRAREQTDLLTGEVCTFGSLGMVTNIYISWGRFNNWEPGQILHQITFTHWIDTPPARHWKSYQTAYI